MYLISSGLETSYVSNTEEWSSVALMTVIHFKCVTVPEKQVLIRSCMQLWNWHKAECEIKTLKQIVIFFLWVTFFEGEPREHVELPTPTYQYLSHEISEEEHIAEESCPSQQMTDTQAAVVAGHVDDSFHQRPECHLLLCLQTHIHHMHQCQCFSTDRVLKKNSFHKTAFPLITLITLLVSHC